MIFDGMQPLRESFPVTVLEADGHLFDVHNCAIIKGFSYDYRRRELSLQWTLETTGDREAGGRVRTAVLALLIFAVDNLAVSLSTRHGVFDDDVTDFLEYSRLSQERGRLRMVTTRGGEIAADGKRIQLKYLLP
jgi:hypothetical protein